MNVMLIQHFFASQRTKKDGIICHIMKNANLTNISKAAAKNMGDKWSFAFR